MGVEFSNLFLVVCLGYKKSRKNGAGLEEEDVKNVKNRDRTDFNFHEFEKNWEAECLRVEEWNRKNPPKPKKVSKVDSEESEKKKDEDDGRKKPSLYRALWHTFRHEILVTAGWKLFNDILTFVNPQILKAILGFLSLPPCDPELLPPGKSCDDYPKREPMWAGYLYAVGLFLETV